jgi:hypothetical protein
MGKYPFSDKQDERREARRPKPEKKVYKIKPRSEKGAKEDRLYSELCRKFKVENPYCKAKLTGCTIYTAEVHHKKGRGIWLLIVKFFFPCCHNCHSKINVMPIEEAVEKGFSLRRID